MSANIVSVDEESLRNDIKNLVRKTVEETLNALLDEEAAELVGAGRYERTAGREAYRSGHYTRRLVTGAGEVELSVPKLRGATFQTAVIERYRRRETSVEEAIVEMYLAGVSTRRIEDVVSVNLFFTSFAKQARRSRKGGFTGCANVFSPIPVTA